MAKYTAALIGVLAVVLIGCGGPNPSGVVGEALEADPSEVLAQAVKAMEENPRFRVAGGWIGSEGEAVLQDYRDLRFVLPDRVFCRQAPGYEVIPFVTVIGEEAYASGDGIRWEELERGMGSTYYQVYHQRWNPYEFLTHAGNPADGGTASVEGRPCRVIQAEVDFDAWANGTGWVSDRTAVELVVYADAESCLPHRVTVLWRTEYPQGTTEFPYVIDISYDDTIAIERPEEVLPEGELKALEQALDSLIEERAGDLVRILSAFKAAYGVFPDRLDLQTVGDVMRAAGLEWPANPTTGAPMSDGQPVPGNYFYRPADDGSDYELAVCSYYSCDHFTYHGLPVEPTTIPWLTDEQKERALAVALADPRVQELLEDRPYDVGGIGPRHMGSKLLGALVQIDLEEPCIIEYDWPSAGVHPVDGSIVEVTRHETAGVETLQIEVSFELERVVSIVPLSFHVFR